MNKEKKEGDRVSKPVLEMKNISKKYGENTILEDISLSLMPGEIHALLGENGAGKSTLMNILFGMPVIHSTGGFGGEILVAGEAADIRSPIDAMKAGIGMVHQEFMLISSFTVAENIKLNREVLKSNLASKILGESYQTLNKKQMNKDARIALDKVGVNLDEKQLVEGLPVGYMQFIEIAREIDKQNMKVLVFDEPTAVLTESEADTLLKTMRKLAASGVAIVFITHRLDEVMDVADSVTILRDGKVAASRKKEETSVVELAELMVGRKIESMGTKTGKEKHTKPILSIKNLYVEMPGEKVKGVDLEICEGEIFGIGGLAGQGKIGIANGLMGLYEASGEIIFQGNPLEVNNPIKPLEAGFAFVSEDRRGVGLLLDQSIENNIALTASTVQGQFLINCGFFKLQNKSAVKKHAEEMIKRLDIRCTGPHQPTGQLSGGNQQKVCLARALTLNPKVLFVSEPTRGIDIGAKKLVLDLLLELKKQGLTIVITSSELAEIRYVADRIAIVSEGKVAGIVQPTASDATFGLLMSGIQTEGGEEHAR